MECLGYFFASLTARRCKISHPNRKSNLPTIITFQGQAVKLRGFWLCFLFPGILGSGVVAILQRWGTILPGFLTGRGNFQVTFITWKSHLAGSGKNISYRKKNTSKIMLAWGDFLALGTLLVGKYILPKWRIFRLVAWVNYTNLPMVFSSVVPGTCEFCCNIWLG